MPPPHQLIPERHAVRPGRAGRVTHGACSKVHIVLNTALPVSARPTGAGADGAFNAILSLTLVFVPQIIRVAEAVTAGVRNLEYVESARASGAGGLISVSMIIASGLSFLGLGTKPPALAMLPGMCISATSLCFNMVSDGLRSAMDVRG